MSAQGSHEYEAVWVEANTPKGNFVIQNNRMPTTLILSKEKPLLYCLATGKIETIKIKTGGVLHLTRESATVLLS